MGLCGPSLSFFAFERCGAQVVGGYLVRSLRPSPSGVLWSGGGGQVGVWSQLLAFWLFVSGLCQGGGVGPFGAFLFGDCLRVLAGFGQLLFFLVSLGFFLFGQAQGCHSGSCPFSFWRAIPFSLASSSFAEQFLLRNFL